MIYIRHVLKWGVKKWGVKTNTENKHLTHHKTKHTHTEFSLSTIYPDPDYNHCHTMSIFRNAHK